MEQDLKIPCICGHLYLEHYFKNPLLWCERCFYEYPTSTQWQHAFKEDNLSYIEKLARERGLV
jgi:hypothetical protein